MTKTLIIYSTTDGHTVKICSRIIETLEQADHKVELVSVDDASGIDLEGFDKIIIGASIRYGKHSKQITDFIERNHQALASKPNAFFSVNLVARKPNKVTAQTNPYVRKFLKRIPWQPQHVMVFAGRVNYQMYTWFDRNMIRLIMWITKGPTDPKADVEFTDWNKVDQFATLVRDL